MTKNESNKMKITSESKKKKSTKSCDNYGKNSNYL